MPAVAQEALIVDRRFPEPGRRRTRPAFQVISPDTLRGWLSDDFPVKFSVLARWRC
ncbi:hypothetical protein [Streptomyces sp. NPDC001508]|uniref:hypothetical protein n=1 Tax=Streptomyces sp. NPDC001508 TaxID=3154656 RepID=UPI00332C33E4